jgi:hypothetical protein
MGGTGSSRRRRDGAPDQIEPDPDFRGLSSGPGRRLVELWKLSILGQFGAPFVLHFWRPPTRLKRRKKRNVFLAPKTRHSVRVTLRYGRQVRTWKEGRAMQWRVAIVDSVFSWDWAFHGAGLLRGDRRTLWWVGEG